MALLHVCVHKRLHFVLLTSNMTANAVMLLRTVYPILCHDSKPDPKPDLSDLHEAVQAWLFGF